MYKVLDVANYVIDYCNDNQMFISNLKLQKLLYFIQAEFLVAKNEPCFLEPIEAWGCGPVVPVAYQHYKLYGSSHILMAKSHDYSIISRDKKLIQGIVDVCAEYSASDLTKITLNQSPWLKTRLGCGVGFMTIPNEFIYNYFKD